MKKQFDEWLLTILRLWQQDNVSTRLQKEFPELQVDWYGNLYCIADDMRPLLNAHMDNVGSETANSHASYIDIEGSIIRNLHNWQTWNIGADDKVGIAIATWIYKHNKDKVNVVFTRDEETGCLGSEYFLKHHRDLLEKCSYCVIADRRGNADIISSDNDYCTIEFQNVIHGMIGNLWYKPAKWVRSDCDTWKLVMNCINLSCWYYNAHSDMEYIKHEETWNCLRAVEQIVLKYNEKLEPVLFEEVKPDALYTRMTGNWSAETSAYPVDATFDVDTVMYDVNTWDEIYIPRWSYMIKEMYWVWRDEDEGLAT